MEPRLRILVVEDDPDLARGTCRLLEQAGYETSQAGTGIAALQAVRDRSPHIVLLDRQLPDMEGLEVCRQIKANPVNAAVLVIIISGILVQNEAQLAGLATGADGYIVRPIGNADLRVRIEAFARIARLHLRLAEEIEQRRLLETELEDRVRSRTAELLAVNQQLEAAQRSAFNSMREALRAQEQLASSNRQLVWEMAERQRTEAVLRNSEAQMRAMLNATLESLFLMEPDGQVVAANLTTAARLGTTLEQLLGRNMYNFLPLHVAERRRPLVAEVVRTGQPVRFEDERLGRWIDQQLYPVFGSDGRVTQVVSFACDITERKQAEAKLRETNAFLENLLNYANAPIIVWDPQFRITRFNHAFESLTGRTEAEVLGQSLELLFLPALAESSMALIRQTLTGQRWEVVEIKIQHRDGSERTVLWNSATLFAPDGQTPLATIAQGQDITKRKQAEEELHQAKAQTQELLAIPELSAAHARDLAGQAELANRAKGEFLANMSHEIRTPMNGVIGMTNLLLETELDVKQRRYAETVRTSGEALLELLNDILDFSKIEAGKLSLEALDFDLALALEDFASVLALRAADKGLEFICAADPDVPTWLCGDAGRLRQVLINLAGNAIKFTPHGEVFVRASSVAATDTAVVVRFAVRDTGIGIPVDKQEKLFQKFSQVDASTTREYGGTGLGLAISKQLAHLMGGEIGFTSTAGQGSEFWFTARFTRPAAPPPAAPEAADLRNAHVLVVGDNATNRMVLATQLRAWAVRVAEAADGPAALQLLARAQEEGDPFQIAIIDLRMPGMDGAALGRAIGENATLKATRLVLLTPLVRLGSSQPMEDRSSAVCLAKPVRKAELFRSLAAYPSAAAIPAPPSPFTRLHLAAFRILLAEDNLTNQQVALGSLEKLGLSTDIVVNGLEVLHALETVPYDLVLMDVQMPELDGLDATRQIRNPVSAVLNHDVPIIAMTANAMARDREECLAAGMNGYVSKPFSSRALAAVLDKWLPKEKGYFAPPAPDDKPSPASRAAAAEPGPQVFDQAGLMERMLDDQALACVVINGFLKDFPLQIETLKASLQAGDAVLVTRQIHTIKGAAASIGGAALRALGEELEQSAKRGDLPAVQARVAELEVSFDRLKSTMSKLL